MKLTLKQIKNYESKIKENNYSSKIVDELLEKIIKDYKNEESTPSILDGTYFPYERSSVKISSNFTGVFEKDKYEFEGTIDEWRAIVDKGIFKNVPSINCEDGVYIQKL